MSGASLRPLRGTIASALPKSTKVPQRSLHLASLPISRWQTACNLQVNLPFTRASRLIARRPTCLTRSLTACPYASKAGEASQPRETILDIDHDPVVRLAKLRMIKRQRLLESTESADGAEVGKQLKELDPLRQAWEVFSAKRKQLVSTLIMSENDPDEDMRALALEEVPLLENELASLRTSMENLILGSVTDAIEAQAVGAVLEVRPGVGGQESTLFTAEVTRMYERFCDQKPADEDGSGEWQVEMLSSTSVDVSTSSSGSGAGLKEAIIEVKGKGAFQKLKFEAGVHRVQRIPATQSLGKLQTSTIAVMVLPISEGSESKADDLVDPKDVKVEVMRSRGAGGQHVNKTESAIRLTHEPTGISVSMQDSRSQHQNRTKAWAVLRARLLDRKLKQEVESNRDRRLAQVASMDRSDRIRTYNFPQDRVTDHRVNLSLNGIDAIMEGEHDAGTGLDYIMESLRIESETRKIKALLEFEEAQAAEAALSSSSKGRT
ncbi:related to MRF1 - peptide chain release factor, mitochondrial [Melanopsichium pennsylvanicum]|uniref:Related to MRF1 - peptide chain release factor, mitochondrial n=2 Tax=Melanopsichium pennsylvanicum TaxID=63383 RepID=A0AAJ4XNG0_9BASI|nr:related to MRF1 - peptide chain release factor, mitochondrial [Melanopsichium pennsylvanicum]